MEDWKKEYNKLEKELHQNIEKISQDIDKEINEWIDSGQMDKELNEPVSKIGKFFKKYLA